MSLGNACAKTCVCVALLFVYDYVVLLVLEMDVDIRSCRESVEPHLISAAQCVALRVLEVVADFLLKGQWTGVLIDKWKGAVQTLETVVEAMPVQVSKYSPGIYL